MFDVLVYLYETYWRPDACPDHQQLTRKLSAVGFESEEIQEALSWLEGLSSSAEAVHEYEDASSLRVYTEAERELLGDECVGFLCFLESAGVLPPEKAAVAPQLIFNQQLDAVLTVLFVGVLWTVIGAMLLGVRRHLAGTCTRASSEAPYVRSALNGAAGPLGAAEAAR